MGRINRLLIVTLITLLTLLSTNNLDALRSLDCNCKINYSEKLKIVNGTEYYSHKYPWLVSLQVRRSSGSYSHTCGGSLLNNKWILTAAHCHYANLTRLGVAIGAHDISQYTNHYQVKQFIQHPEYTDSPIVKNDLALIELEQEVPFSKEVQPACLTSRNIYFTGSDLYVAGWGVTDEQQHTPTNTPLEVKMDHMNHLRCTLAWVGLLSYGSHICAIAMQSSPCFGDSGGPLMLAHQSGLVYLVGVVSFGNSCAGTMPTVFTRVTSYLDWITNTSKTFCLRND